MVLFDKETTGAVNSREERKLGDYNDEGSQ